MSSLATRGLYCNTPGAAPFTAGIYCTAGAASFIKLCVLASIVQLSQQVEAGLRCVSPCLAAQLAQVSPIAEAGLRPTGSVGATVTTASVIAGLEEC